MPLAAPIVAAIIGGGASIAGGALANRGSQSQTTTPTLDPTFSPLQNRILSLITQRLSSSPDLSGYTASGISDINRTYDLSRQAAENDLTRRGLASSPVAAVVDTTRNLSRAGDIARFQNTIPLLQRQLQTDDLETAGNVLRLGRGQTSTGTVASGGGAAGAFSNLAQYLGYLIGRGTFGQKNGLPGQFPMPTAFGMPGAY